MTTSAPAPARSARPRKPRQGDLRNALIDAGIALLDSGGPDALTLRGCAAGAGVSHAAPAHHFNGLPGLRAAIAGRGYALFTACMIEHRRRAPPRPDARLLAICEGYLRFSREHPALFALMFNTDVDLAADPAAQEQAGAAYRVLVEGCAPFAGDGRDAATTEVMVWSLVHGFACLRNAGRRRGTAGGDSWPDFGGILSWLLTPGDRPAPGEG